MQEHGVADEVGQRVPRQHAQTDIKMGLDDRIFCVGQAIRLAQDRIGHTYFSQVVQEPAQADSGSCGIAAALADSLLLWHPRQDADPAHRWLRGLIVDTCAATR